MARLRFVACGLALVVVLTGAASHASAQEVTVSFANKGTVSTASFREAALASTPELNPPLLRFLDGNGLGVVGGTADSVIDAGESVLFALDLAATGVSYVVQFAQDADGDGEFGECEVEGYGAGGVWLGTAAISGVAPPDISAAFAGQPLTALRVRPSERIRLRSLSYNSGAPVTVSFADKSTVSTAGFRATGLTVTPELNPPLLRFLDGNGLGVVGGTADSVIDAGESVLFALDLAATGVSYVVQFAQDADGDGEFGECEVEGYGAGGVWLGTAAISGVAPPDISAAFAGQPLTALRVRPSERIRLRSLSYNSGAPVTVSFADKSTVSTAGFRATGLTVTPELNPPLLRFLDGNGLGVVGGTADSVIDAGESVLFALDLAATGVSYVVQFAQDADGDGEFGECEVEGYGAGGVWLGTAAISGVAPPDISAAFAGQPLTALRVRPSERIRLRSLSYNSGAPVTVSFADKSTVSTAGFRATGLTVTPELNPPLLRFLDGNGLGVVGGTADSVIDAGESVLFALDLAATGVSYVVQFAQDADGDGEFGECEVEGYGAGGVWLGTAAISGVAPPDISAAFAGQPLTALRVRPSERIRIRSLSYTPVPLPAAPQGLVGRAKAYKVNLAWQTAADADVYRIFRKLNGEAAFSEQGVTVLTAFVDYMPAGTASAQVLHRRGERLGRQPALGDHHRVAHVPVNGRRRVRVTDGRRIRPAGFLYRRGCRPTGGEHVHGFSLGAAAAR